MGTHCGHFRGIYTQDNPCVGKSNINFSGIECVQALFTGDSCEIQYKYNENLISINVGAIESHMVSHQKDLLRKECLL